MKKYFHYIQVILTKAKHGPFSISENFKNYYIMSFFKKKKKANAADSCKYKTGLN